MESCKIDCPENYIILVVDKASWHTAKGLDIPQNIEIIPLPVRAGDFNPLPGFAT